MLMSMYASTFTLLGKIIEEVMKNIGYPTPQGSGKTYPPLPVG